MLRADPKAIKLFNIVDVQNEPLFLFVDLELQFKSFRDAIERIGLELTSTPNARAVSLPAYKSYFIKKIRILIGSAKAARSN